MPATETVDELVVLLSADYNDFTGGMQTVESVLERTERRVNEITNNMAMFGAALSVAVTLPMKQVGDASLNMAIDVEETKNLFSVAMGDMAKDGISFSERLRKELGLNVFEVQKFMSTLYNMTTSMGLSSKSAYELSENFTQLVYDIASFYNLSIEESFTKLRAGITGETEPLKAIGILVDENTVKQVAYANGIAETGTQLTQTQKVQARYLAIMEQTVNAQGDLSRTLDDTANKSRIFENRMKETSLILGNDLKDAYDGLLSVGLELLDWFINMDEATREMVINLGMFTAAIGPASLAIAGLSKAMMFLVANPYAAVIAAIGSGIAAMAFYTFEARAEQDRYNASLERLEQIKERGLRQDEITSLESEINDAQNLVKEYDKVIDKITETREVLSEKYENNEMLDEEQLQLELYQEELKMLEEELYDLGYSYESAKEMIRLYNQEVAVNADLTERLNAIHTVREKLNNNEIDSKVQLYNINSSNLGKLRDMVAEYTELTSKEKLDMEQKARLIELTQGVSGVLGKEVLSRNELGEAIGLNIEATNLEIESMGNSANAQKQSVKEMIGAQLEWTKVQLEETRKRITASYKEMNFIRKQAELFGEESAGSKLIGNVQEEQEELRKLSSELSKEIGDLEQSLLSLEHSSYKSFSTYKSEVDDTSDKLKKQKQTTESIKEANEELRDIYQDQTKAIQNQKQALSDAYKETKEGIKESESSALDAIKNVIQKEKDKHKDKLQAIKDEKDAKLQAIQDEIDAIEGSARSEDREDKLNDLESLYSAYSQSTTAEGKARAEELRKEIRDLKNEKTIEGLKATKEAITEEAKAKEDAEKTEYEKTVKHFEDMQEEVKVIIEQKYEDLEIAFKNEENLLNQQLFIKEGLYKEANTLLEDYSKDNEDIYIDSAETILKMLASKEDEFYKQGERLAKEYQQGIQDQLNSMDTYMNSLKVQNVPAPPLKGNGTSSSPQGSNTNHIYFNDYGDKNIQTDQDWQELNNEQAKTFVDAIKGGNSE